MVILPCGLKKTVRAALFGASPHAPDFFGLCFPQKGRSAAPAALSALPRRTIMRLFQWALFKYIKVKKRRGFFENPQKSLPVRQKSAPGAQGAGQTANKSNK